MKNADKRGESMTFIHKMYLTLSVLVLALIGLIIGSVVSEEKPDRELKATEDVTQSYYPGIQIATDVQEESHYHTAVHYPIFKDDKLNEEIATLVEKETKRYLEEVADNETLLMEREWQASFYLTFDLYPVEDDLYSVVFNVASYVTGANGRQSSTIFMVDLAEEAFLTAEAIIQTDEATREVIYSALNKRFETSDDYREMFFNDALKDWSETTDFSNLYLTDEAVMFKFDKYEVTAGAAGSPEIAIPLEEAGGFLKEVWVERLAIADVKEESSEVDEPSSNDEEEQVEAEQPSSSGEKKVALTFDDGPHPKNTLKALQLLDKYDMKATFFMLGSRIDFYPDLVQEVFDRGHEIGNHTWNHKQLTKISDADIKEEINAVNQRLESITGERATVFRPPYGATNDHVESFLTVPSVLWTIDTLDWKTKDKAAILAEVKENLKPGAIILMHDIHATTIEALEVVLPYLKEQGYTSVKVSDV